jgi:hypothetical protein
MQKLYAMLAEVPFDVFKFCKENDIHCSWDFGIKNNLEWTEILLDDKLVIQIDKNCQRNQFVELCFLLNKDFINGGNSVSGNDFWFAIEDENLFKKFFTKYEDVFRHFCQLAHS